MNVVVVYDSKFGNTERIARAIGEELGCPESVQVVMAGDANEHLLAGIELLVVGGPTQGHGLSPALTSFLEQLPADAVRDVPAATFDTRLTWPRILAGSAAGAAAKRLAKKGARLLLTPESFLVTGSEGPLVEGELDRARSWAKVLRAKAGLPEPKPALAIG